MAQIRDLISNASEVWEAKDEARAAHILERNPVALNKTEFNAYVRARTKAFAIELLEEGTNPTQIPDIIEADIRRLRGMWSRQAKTLAIGLKKHQRVLERHKGFRDLIDPERGE